MSGPYSLQDAQLRYQGSQVGDFGYAAGVGGTRVITGKVLTIVAHSTVGGSVVINGGDTIPVPANVGFAFSPSGLLVNPSIDFNGTDMYLVEYVT